MGTLVWKDAYVAFNSTQLNGVRSLTVNHQTETEEDTVMGQDTKSNLPALKNWSASVTFAQDFNAGAIDAQLFSLMGTRFAVEFRPTTAAVSTQNPKYTSYAILSDDGIFGGGVGEFAESPVSLVPAKSSTGGDTTSDLLRATS